MASGIGAALSGEGGSFGDLPVGSVASALRRPRRHVPHHPRYHEVLSLAGGSAQPQLGLDFIDKAKEAQRGTSRTKRLEGHLENLRYRMQNRDALIARAAVKTADGAEVPPVEAASGSATEEPEVRQRDHGERVWKPVVHGEHMFSKERIAQGTTPVVPPPPAPACDYPRVVYRRDKPGGEGSAGPPVFLHSKHSVGARKEDKDDKLSKEVSRLLSKESENDWAHLKRMWTHGESQELVQQLAPLEQALANTQKIWVANRAKDVERDLEEKEFRDTMSLWAQNHARVEEEIHRRLESGEVASQTGRTHHLILGASRPRTSQGSAAFRSLSADLPARPASAEPHVTSPIPAPSAAELRARRKQRAITSPSAADLAPAEFTNDEVYGHKLRARGGPVSLSAYDHTMPSRFERILQQRDDTLAIQTHNDEQKDTLKRFGVKMPHDEYLRGTSALNMQLDIVADEDTKMVPAPLEGRPPDCKAVKPARKGTKGKKGAAKPRKAAAPGEEKKGKLKKEDVQDKKWLMSHYFPAKNWTIWNQDEKRPETWRGGLVLNRSDDVPSLRRVEEMQMVQRVRDCLAKHGGQVPLRVIEEGILTPEDRPFHECIANLPRPDDGFCRNFDKMRPDKGKKKKGSSGKKKKKKK